jgi:exonuclease III
MTNEKAQFAEDDRNAIARRLGPWANSLNAQMGINAPTTVLMADLNSFKDRQPRGAQFTLTKNGWKDSWNAKKRINIQYSTINVTPDTRKFGGWPPKPNMRWDKGAGTRIDYIMAKGPATFTEYEVMLWVNANGTFNTNYQASDHQAIRAVVKF